MSIFNIVDVLKEQDSASNTGERNPVVIASIDELTFVIKPTEDTIGDYPSHWYQIATELVGTVIDKLSLDSLFGEVINVSTPPAGYTNAVSFKNLPHYFSIAFHETNFVMGIVIKFSAAALAYYRDAFKEYFEESIDVHGMSKLLDEPYWQLRISRIDLAIDYFNFGMSVDELYKGIKGSSVILKNHRGIKNTSKIVATEVDNVVNTIYFGSKKKNSNALLRVYNKKQEQLDKHGRFLHLLTLCNSWVRFEASYRGNFSNQILKQLLTVNNEDELGKLVANKMIDKYSFYDVEKNEPIEFTKYLEHTQSLYTGLKSLSSRNNDLMSTISHIMKGSGFFPLIKKVESIWGIEARNKFIIRLIQEYERHYNPNQDVDLWLKKFATELSKIPFDSFLEDSLSVYYKNTKTKKGKSRFEVVEK